jgi:flagellar assembly protein FliH
VKKYLFDLYRFDTPTDDTPEEDAPPPPPVFNEEELGSAKDEAYRLGRQDGFRESEEGISREISTLLGILNSQLDDLLQAEKLRQERFQENLILSLQGLYAQTVPTLVNDQAWPMLMRMVQETIDAHKPTTLLEFTVPESYVDTLKAHLDKLYGARAALFTVLGDPLLPPGDCKVVWQNGGGVQDLGALKAQILDRINQLLAEKGASAHDHTVHTAAAPSQDAATDNDKDQT